MTTTNFRDEIVAALARGALFDDLLTIVSHHKAAGMSQRAAYDTLQGIWMELGCNQDEGAENPTCDLLEGLMDLVWGYCSTRDAIWESSLSEAPNE